MKTLHIFSLVSVVSVCGAIQAQENFIDHMFDEVRHQMEETHKHMEAMWSNFGKAMDNAWSQLPTVTRSTSMNVPLDISYDDPSHIVITMHFEPGSIKEADAEAHEKRNILTLSILKEDGKMNATIDRRGMSIACEQRSEKKTTSEDKKESTQMSYQSQHWYQGFQVAVEAAKAEINLKDNTLSIILPREEKIKKVHIKREETTLDPTEISIKE